MGGIGSGTDNALTKKMYATRIKPISSSKQFKRSRKFN
jgi:hypothetical protein